MTRPLLRAIALSASVVAALVPAGGRAADPPPRASPAAPPIDEAWGEEGEFDEQLDALELDALKEEPAQPAPQLPVLRRDAPPIASMKSLPEDADLIRRAHKNGAGQLVVEVNGAQRTLTLAPDLQQELTDLLRSYQTPYAAVVALEPHTGRVLAMAEHSEAHPGLRGLATAAVFPAASIFKLVTASALLAEGVGPDTTECFHGGKRHLTLRHLVDSAQDYRCDTLSEALAASANAVFAKLTMKHLTPEKLRTWAEAFQFNRQIPFAIPTDVSAAAFPEDELGFASAGAGFGDVFLSPLHGAALASVVANQGVWHGPVLFEDQASAVAPGTRVMPPEQAALLASMMEETVTHGTARRIFRQRGLGVPGAVGKTGSLADRKPFRDYSWFVGYAPKDDPQVAVAAVIVNDYYWRIRATWLAREAMRLYLKRAAPKPQAPTQGRSAPATR